MSAPGLGPKPARWSHRPLLSARPELFKRFGDPNAPTASFRNDMPLCVPFWEATGHYVRNVAPYATTGGMRDGLILGSGSEWRNGKCGIGLYCGGGTGSTTGVTFGNHGFMTTLDLPVAIECIFETTSNTRGCLVGTHGNLTRYSGLTLEHDANGITAFYGDAGGTASGDRRDFYWNLGRSDWATGVPFHVILQFWDPHPTTPTLYVNGLQYTVTSNSGTGSAPEGYTSGTQVGTCVGARAHTAGTNNFTGIIYFAAIYGHRLSPAQMANRFRDPWGPIRPGRHVIGNAALDSFYDPPAPVAGLTTQQSIVIAG